MAMRSVLTGAALVGGCVTLCGCGTSTDPEPTTPPETPPGPVQIAWDNHFAAFDMGAAAGAADKADDRKLALDKIMEDYNGESRIAVFNDKCAGGFGAMPQKRNGYKEYTTEVEIRSFFDALFQQIESDANLDAVGPTSDGPVVLEGGSSAANVFLTWRTKGLTGVKKIDYATDSFSFKETAGKAMIWKQNIVSTEPEGVCTDFATALPAACTDAEKNGDNKVCAGWENHFTNFGLGAAAATETDVTGVWAIDPAKMTIALDGIMKDYTTDSIIQVFDNRGKAYSKFDSLEKIRSMFEGLFTDILTAATVQFSPDTVGLTVLVLEVEKAFNGVFLVWSSNSHPKATDTFVFNEAGKIIRQNIVVTTKEALSEVNVQV